MRRIFGTQDDNTIFSSSNNGRSVSEVFSGTPCIHPANSPKPNFYIHKMFEEKVYSHILKNYVADDCSINIPLILAIQGTQGDGKSSQVREACSRNGIYVYPLSGSFLSGSLEKESVEILMNSYMSSFRIAIETGQMIVLMVDDFDLSVASTFKDREYIVNSQLLAGFLMNLADDPTVCGEAKVSRVPIIITGNNFTALHEPLTRHGRMDFFTWSPTTEQKIQIVKEMYARCIQGDPYNVISELVSEFSDEPISFFDSLKNDFLDHVICQQISQKKQVKLSDVKKVARNAFNDGINPNKLKELALARKAIQRKDYTRYDLCATEKLPPNES